LKESLLNKDVARFHYENALVQKVLDSAFQVHRELGPGLFESVYEAALFYELQDEQGIEVQRQVPIPACYKGRNLGIGFRADILVEDWLLLELKAVDQISEQHVSQVITYLKLMGLHRGYLLNFNKKLLKDGLKRISI
jgi:GxxExxY protein